jgi:phosphatidylglycerol:prolipoprotein diacylglycerol transferase
MLIHPQFDPVLLHIGPISLRWYGLMYLIGFLMFSYLGKKRVKQGLAPFENIQQVEDLLVYGVLGVVLGGRLGYMIFYAPQTYFAQGLDGIKAIFKIWEGGMSFHGGLLGVLIATWLFCKKYAYSFFAVTDFIAPMAALGLFFGRMGNFINGELWGRVSTGGWPWLMGFPQAYLQDIQWLSQSDMTITMPLPRHPSQLYEMFTEGFLLFVILWLLSKKARTTGHISAYFLILYAFMRGIIEFFRQPDIHLQHLPLGLTMGQWLCIPMLIFGLYLRCRKPI